MEDFRTDNDFQIVDMEMLSIHCKQIDKDAKAMGLPNLTDDFDTEMDRMIWMVQMLYNRVVMQTSGR